MTYREFQLRREVWEAIGSQTMTREDVIAFDQFFADPEESGEYQSPGFTRALAGDFSQYETVEPMMKAYLGAKKCYDLYDRYNGDASDPRLQQEIKDRLMEVDLRAGFAIGGKDPQDPVSRFLKACEQSANRQMLMQTLETPEPNAKLRLMEQFRREDPATAQRKMDAALNNDLEQRVEIAKILFMNHLGKFQVYNSQQQPIEMEENIAEVYTHGGRTMFILPAGANQKSVMDRIQGDHRDLSGLQSRNFATHSAKPRTFNADGSIASEAKELKVGGLNAFSPGRHRGMDVSVGGLGQIGPNGKMISADGTNGHMYMHLIEGKENTCGTMLVGFENSAPGMDGRLGHAHDASAKKAGSSAFLTDKSYVGREYGGRVVDLSGLSGAELSSLLAQFEEGYRRAATAAQTGDTALLDSCNDLLTGKQMSVGQMKGLLQGLQVPENQMGIVEQARQGHPAAEGYQAIAPGEKATVPMKPAENSEKRPFRVTEFEGLLRPEPPKVMKKPSRWDKLMHQLSFHSKNSYVSRYKAYERTIPDRMAAYKAEMQEYNRTLEALERGENPGGLREAYNRAVAQAKAKYGIPEKKTSAPQKQKIAASSDKKATSREVTEQLENALLDTLFEGLDSGNTSKEEQFNLREEFRGHIRETDGYKKLIKTGDGNITKILNNPEQMQLVCADVINGILEKIEPKEKAPTNNEPQRNNEKEMNPAKNAPKALGG